MANLPEILQFDAGVYQIETTDPVLGGPNGLSNVPFKNLANRTAYLKKHVDDLEAGTTVPPGIATEAFVAAEINKLDNKQSVRAATTANITLAGTQTIDGVNLVSGDRTLVKNQNAPAENGLYVVQGGGWIRTGDADSNADVTPGLAVAVEEGTLQGDTVWKLTTNAPIALGTTGLTFADITTGYAPLASPALTGNPTAPTPVQFDDDTSLATTAFTQRALGSLRSQNFYTVSTVLDATNIGAVNEFSSSSGLVCTIPPSSAAPKGAGLWVMNNGTANLTVARSGADILENGSATLTSLTLKTGDSVYLVSNGGTKWLILSGSGQLPTSPLFGASIAGNGYQKLPSGLIVQWGSLQVTMPAGNTLYNTPVSFPIAFTNGAHAVLSTPSNCPNSSWITVSSESFTASGFTLVSAMGAGSGAPTNVRWWAIGK